MRDAVASHAGAAQAACARLLVDFANAMDCHDHTRVLGLFTEDAVLERPGSVLRGKQEIDGFLQQRPRQRVTRHLCTNQSVDVASSERATGQAYVLFFQALNEGAAELPLPTPEPALVEYRATFLRNDGQWRMQDLAIRMVYSN
jgi:ketosteroid isomerase-like protein